MHRKIMYSSLAGLTAAAGIMAWSWFVGREPGTTHDRVATRATSIEPARFPRIAAAAVPLAGSQAVGADAIKPVSTDQPVRTTRQPAHIEPYERTAIYAKASGFVKNVHADLGSRVKQGEILAELWIPEMEQDLLQKKARVDEAAASVGQAEAAIVAAEAAVVAAAAKVKESRSMISRYQAEVELRRIEYHRISELVQRKSIQQALQDEKLQQLHSAEAALAAAEAAVISAEANERVEQAHAKQAGANRLLAQARLQVAQAELKQTEVLMAYAVIRAPYDGIVTERLVNTGDFARSAASGTTEALFTVMRESPLRVVVDIPESDAGWVRTGLQATLSVDAIKDQTCVGVVRRTAEMLDPQMHTLRIEVEVTDPPEGLRPGMYGAATITDSPPIQEAGHNPAGFGAIVTN
jgi:multidrug resistance efflux pump